MFSKRKTHKPTQDFFLDFKKNYSGITHTSNDAPATPAQTLGSTSMDEGLSMSFNTNQWDHGDDGKNHMFDPNGDWPTLFDTSANGFGEVWCQPTPAIDASLDFSSIDNSMLNLPLDSAMSLGTGLNTPISRAMGTTGLHDTQPSGLHMNDFMASQYNHAGLYNPQQAFNPMQLPSQNNLHYPGPPVYKGMHDQHVNVKYEAPQERDAIRRKAEKFRFRACLLANTAMVKSDEDDPESYLNKCQTYKLCIKDSAPINMPGTATQYRTYVRIFFDDDREREKPGALWQLWKEGRGINEAHQRGGRLQAMEFVPSSQGQSMHRGSNVELQSESFDGFSVLWAPTYHNQTECEIQLRFNFLSTDFSHSKGVKGTAMRLTAKTEVISTSPNMAPPAARSTEISFCKVKLFRDHGAERKISNDEAGVKKGIEKLTQQLAQRQSSGGINENGKRRRSDSMAASRPPKLARHKRGVSIASVDSAPGRDPAEDDIHTKLARLQSMLVSRRQESLLYLEGEELDDPDLNPVTLPGTTGAVPTIGSPELQRLERRTTFETQTSMESPTPSSIDFGSPSRKDSGLSPLQGMPPSGMKLEASPAQPAVVGVQSMNPQNLISPPEEVTKVQKADSDWINATGVDQGYEPPVAQKKTPVACFYIQQKSTNTTSTSALFRAVYVHQRTLQDFIAAIARKYNVEPTAITTAIRINARGLKIELDDESIIEMPEGQDMITELDFVDSSPFRKLTLRY